jgi:hypothetical protein
MMLVDMLKGVHQAQPADNGKESQAAFVIKSASGSAVHVSDPLGPDVATLVTPDVIERASEARREAGIS